MRELSRFSRQIAIWTCIGLATAAFSQTSPVQNSREFNRVFSVTFKDPVRLDIDLSDGDLQVNYARDGQVSATVVAQGPDSANVDRNLLVDALNIRQDGNHLELRRLSDTTLLGRKIKLIYRLDVPYRTELHSFLEHGKQTIIGIMGPIDAKTKRGDLKISYVSKEVDARTEAGSVDLQVIGGRIKAVAGIGDISCTRAPLGISARTDDGQISLVVVGPSIATVKTGNGGIDAQGVRGTLVANTAAGDVHVKAVPHDDWQLASSTGNVRIEFPPEAGVDLDASSTSGEVTVNRDDIQKSSPDVHRLQQKVNGGGKRIVAHTNSGRVVIG